MVVDDVCCLYLRRFVCFRGVSATQPPKSAGIKLPLLYFACYATCSILLVMLTPAYGFVNAEKAYLCAVVRASIMGQGLPVSCRERFSKTTPEAGKPPPQIKCFVLKSRESSFVHFKSFSLPTTEDGQAQTCSRHHPPAQTQRILTCHILISLYIPNRRVRNNISYEL